MARQKRDAAPANFRQREGSAGWTIGRRHLDLVGGVEPFVETGSAEDADLRRRRHQVRTCPRGET